MNEEQGRAFSCRQDAFRACFQWQVQLSNRCNFLPSLFPYECVPHRPLPLLSGKRNKICPRLLVGLGHDRGTDRNRRASNHRSHLARIPLEKLFSGRGHLLVYQEHATTSSPRDDPFTSALDHPRLLSLPDHPQVVPDPRWKIPPSAWGTVLQRVEQGEPLPHIACAYGVSYEAVRRVLRAARRC